MYEDYPTVYETTLNEELIYFIIIGVVALLLIIISLIALAKIFKKANRSGISAFIPIYNIITLLEITNSPKIYLLFYLIPGLNIIFSLIVMFSLANSFRKSKAFGLGLMFLPFIFYPILAFGKYEYIGINLTALGGKTQVADIPVSLQSEEKNVVIHEEKDTASRNINISIGGGVYEKEYTSSLLNVDQKQAIPQTKEVELIPKVIDPVKQTFIKPVEDEPLPEPEPKTMGIDFPTQISEIPVPQPNISQQVQMQNSVINQNIQPVNQVPLVGATNIAEQPSQIQKIPNNETLQNSEYISCPKCGAKIKRGVPTCFLCGRKFD